jgi:hypothetical protein
MAANKQRARWAALAGASSLARHRRMSTPGVQLMDARRCSSAGGLGGRGTVEQVGPLPRSCFGSGRPAGRHWQPLGGCTGSGLEDSLDLCGFNVHDHGGAVSQRSAEARTAPFLPTGTQPPH